MIVLGVDTATSHASVAIVENGRLLTEKLPGAGAVTAARPGSSRNHHGEVLVPLIDAALKSAVLTLDDIDGYAVAIGPGSFTGLRIGLSTVKSLAYASKVTVTAVSTLHAVASRVNGFNGIICSLLDARKKEVYAALFRRRDAVLERLSDDVVLPCERLAELLRGVDRSQPILLAGDGAVVYGERLIASVGAHLGIAAEQDLMTVAAAVAFIALPDAGRTDTLPQASLEPRYLRLPEAELRAQKLG
jgi:tRNA threonylcarbamoyladenosine biosynthesis protein TsaB